MAKKPALPVEVHDHFRKANVLHGYVEKSLGEATKHALETGQELLAAKETIPHGRWEDDCARLFDGTLRTAQFYMQFAKHVSALPKAQSSALLLLEGTLDGAAKAAKKAAKPPAPEPPSPPPPSGDPFEAPESPDTASEPEGAPESPKPPRGRRAKRGDKLEPCPNCRGTKWTDDGDGMTIKDCVKCGHPYGEPAGDVDDDQIKTQRQKTRKSSEALLRAFDDLQCMKATQFHAGATTWTDKDVVSTLEDMGVLRACKGMLTIIERW